MSFNTISRMMLDNWLSQSDPSPEQIYASILDRVSIRWQIAIIRLGGKDPADWMFEPVKQMGIVSRLLNINAIFKSGPVADIPDGKYLEETVLPRYRSVIQSRQPAIDRVDARLLGIKVIYDRIVLPEKSENDPSWLVTGCFGRFLSPLPDSNPVVDDLDQSIFLHLTAGHPAKEIATILHLSPRTVEHRIDRMRRHMGAKNTAHLVALLMTAGFEGEIRFRADRQA
ncbi:LuxR C-terminal-related transcriptional regulator [Rhizobium sp. C4]|uniref:LuxR C-terminal-related transcriptional regulator n=1 Tax=Rhizobium sp. C4 TaxID=1349800 RepID=UPI001E5ECF12|nr:helix-turn-helix transcriptional regulator [Rhizobium sp. C4]MCD2175628.1 helix-turn-helix transcriptional regulator [Rhizobium sp. C4]